MVFSGVPHFALGTIIVIIALITSVGVITLRCPCPWTCTLPRKRTGAHYIKPTYPHLIVEQIPTTLNTLTLKPIEAAPDEVLFSI